MQSVISKEELNKKLVSFVYILPLNLQAWDVFSELTRLHYLSAMESGRLCG